MVQVKHGFNSSKADGADVTQIQPSHWNADHTIAIAGPALIGKPTAGNGPAVEITLGAGLQFLGTTLEATGGGGGSGSTNLSVTTAANTITVTSDTGDDATLPSATTSTAGVMTATDKSKLNGIASGATQNSQDSVLLDRANHTGTQSIATVSGLQAALDSKATASSVSTLQAEVDGKIDLVAAPSVFSARALATGDNGAVLVCAMAQVATVNAGLPAAFGCSFKGAINFTAGGGVTINDNRATGAVHLWCSLVQVGAETYDVIGGKA